MSKTNTLFGSSNESVASTKRLGYVGSDVRGTVDSRNDDWYTPREWITFASTVLGGIGLDPFSSEEANKVVRAKRFFTIQDNALKQKWKSKTVWMNPPYTRGIVDAAVSKFLQEFGDQNFEAGMVLVNNMTDTRWYGSMYEHAHAVCNLIGRIGFENAAGQRMSGNTRGQSLFLFAHNTPSTTHIKGRFTSLLRAKHQYPLFLGV